ncbi:hypothetical protein EZ449_14210 [Pedobacter frigidisoli]|uniref:Uncharacterized protein n=1 Tax=Pedobacter frigidisoli TaxID=2530455 RepID=A0A4R0NZR3_9SPHI|nr:hypothetical protein [Pedobacter frigidisoli]TCD07685.1 hypothetical protein EZ449_14210 [Pedobacter frigidisoli]
MISWTNFLLYMSLIYLIYYSINLLFDLLLSSPSNGAGLDEDPVFLVQDLQEPIDASIIDPADADLLSGGSTGDLLHSGETSSSGGVSLAALFSLASEDAIVFTKQIAA